MITKSFILSLLFGLVSLWFLSTIIYPATHQITSAASTYYTASHLLAQGQISAQIYDPDYFRALTDDIYNANPPTTSLLFLPFVLLPLATTNALWTWANLAMLLIIIGLLIHTFAPIYISQNNKLGCKPKGLHHYNRVNLKVCTPNKFNLYPHTRHIFLTVLIFAMLFQPIIANFQLGQAYIAMTLLMTIVIITHHQEKPAPLGLALGLALLLKTVGWSMIPLLMWQKKWAALAWTAATLTLIIGLTFPLFHLNTWQAYFQLLRQTTHSSITCVTAYQTTASLLCRIFGSTNDVTLFNTSLINLPLLNTLIWFALAISTFITTFLISQSNATASLMLSLTWAILFAPLGEQYHHTVIFIPLIWLYLHGLSTKLEIITFALILGLYAIPLNFNHATYQTGGLTVLAYPRLYAAWLTAGLLIFNYSAKIREER